MRFDSISFYALIISDAEDIVVLDLTLILRPFQEYRVVDNVVTDFEIIIIFHQIIVITVTILALLSDIYFSNTLWTSNYEWLDVCFLSFYVTIFSLSTRLLSNC